jgi:hypothetical protein
MKNRLRQHAGRILFASVLTLCAAVLAGKLSHNDDAFFEDCRNTLTRFEALLHRSPINYKFGPPYLDYMSEFAASQDRVRHEVTATPKRLAYPDLSRPQIDPGTLPFPADERHIVLAARPVLDASVKPTHGRLLVGFKVPENTTVDMMVEKTDSGGRRFIASEKTPAVTIVGAEIFRGASPDTIDTKVPYNRIDLLPLNPALIPAQLANMRVFEDTHVEPQTTYFYKVRLIARVEVVLDAFLAEKDPKNPEKTLRKTIFQVAPDAQAVSAAQPNANVKLLASPLSAVVSATAPAEYKFKFGGVNGEFSAPDERVHLVRQDYAALFDTQVWVSQAQEWRSVTLELTKGQALKGYVRGKNKPKRYEFDAHRQLEEVVWRTETATQEIEESIPDPGNAGGFIKQTRKVQVESIPFKVAIVKDLISGELEQYREGRDPEKSEQDAQSFVILVNAEEEARRHK